MRPIGRLRAPPRNSLTCSPELVLATMSAGKKKRERESDIPSSLADDDSPTTVGASTTNFRNVSACNRCRNRKNRCDQKLPKCTNCEKANVRCVGFDPVSKREIPRSYVYYLETRVNNLEAILNSHAIPSPPPSQDFAISESIKPGINVPFPVQDDANTPPQPAPFPEKELGSRLVDLYFEHANPQIPTLHRGEFIALFDRVYATDAKKRTPRELYMLNIVFAIGSGIIVDTSSIEQRVAATESTESGQPNKKRQKFSNHQHQPEQYHSSAIIHLESFLGSSPAAEGVGGGLEELQAVLLLAGLALLRPVAPGLWYIIGVAVRLSIDLGLHFEDVDHDLDARATHPDVDMSNQSLGRKQWTRDLRRRLWWCVFNLDRLVSSCVGRPVAVNEAVVTTEFPSLLDDKYITPAGFLKPPNSIERPSYKLVTRQYIRLRLLQSEILQVLQHRQAESARRMGANSNNEFIPTGLESPYLRPFRSFREWRINIDRRLLEWKESSPNQWDTGVGFNPLFLELNYWQAVIMLYRQSLSVPEQLASELSPATGDDVQSPGNVNFEHEEDKQMVFIKVAEAGQMVLRIYRQLHRLKLVNYTFLATHHLFMSGISFLYAIWHSTLVRSQMTIDDVDFTVLAATSVLSDLVSKLKGARCDSAGLQAAGVAVSETLGRSQATLLERRPQPLWFATHADPHALRF
ncbi:hypothetical protein AC579_5573 [Pseudocercospora musae]|uniref:Zn(2)-C6 fungal-type domain-containing protein n=1 Tax=Pseudocercospora musae TaxID=113226 RepID=A0A139INM6_9PEZI|nr:hypothetical protein AC579_5573 [Pseudocercospora musae]